jgi:hypothetical protein
MDAFRLSLIAENSRLCKLSASPDGAMSIRSIYRALWGRWPDEELIAIAEVARVNTIRGKKDRIL